MKKIFITLSLLGALKTAGFQPVDINVASLEQLALLPGIGEKLAKKIVVTRNKNGPFSAETQLLGVPGLSDKKLAAIKGQISFGKAKKTQTSEKNLSQPKLLALKAPPDLLPLLESILHAQGLTTYLDESLAKRARKSAFLPRLSASFDVDHATATAEKRGDNSRDSWLTRGGRDFGIGVKVIFDLDKLIFNSEELEVAKLSLKRLEVRDEVLRRAQQSYFSYLRLYESAQEPLEEHVAQKITFELAQLSAQLDAMSNGAFTRLQVMEQGS
jgi:competence ComEA-like helix-hairpin-helix protein